jgi:hypothetical protein
MPVEALLVAVIMLLLLVVIYQGLREDKQARDVRR